MCPEGFWELAAPYAVMIAIDSVDAGCWARATAPLLAAAHQGDSSGLKRHQRELCREAERIPGAQPHSVGRCYVCSSAKPVEILLPPRQATAGICRSPLGDGHSQAEGDSLTSTLPPTDGADGP